MGASLRISSPGAPPSPPLHPIRPSKVFRIPLFFALGLLLSLSLSALYAHHARPDLLPSFLVFSSTPSHIPRPSGGIHDLPLTLEVRLSWLLSRPALAQWEAELPSRHACPMFTYSRNTYFFHNGDVTDHWAAIGPTEIRKYRSKMVEYLRNVERQGGKLVWEKGMDDHVPKHLRRGLILTGGQGKTLERVKLSLHMLRNVIGSTIPIELYHFPDELQDEEERRELEDSFDVALKSVGQKRFNMEKSWNVKNEAFLATNFTEFIYLDSDNIPLRDPERLFDSVEYRQSGSVFWSDLNKDHPDNAIFRILGRYCSDEHWPAEAGQLLFDKRGNNGLNLAVLHIANHMMGQSDLYGKLSYGDKDLFRFAFYALGLDYQQATKMFASAGGYQAPNGESSSEFCGHSMLHWGLTPLDKINDEDYHPEPYFLHTILAKGRDKLQPSKLFSHVTMPRLDGINEPLLVRTLYEFTGQCFAISLKGPDGAPGSERSVGDGQGVLTLSTKDVVGRETWQALEALSEKYVSIG
ncbi:mannosyltransferase putative-domain-containing protein [Papiliotrema laurentii]|uniref:Mannosyltransferase putative-domain-containing protein n=1 Tax=Papiliotrema laurentii TaxID=5418 RepID=A0AAD9FW35_PAPLA|nr:mannosyltransferase putative-domain-containing protein [Papiliotrema laurentii]